MSLLRIFGSIRLARPDSKLISTRDRFHARFCLGRQIHTSVVVCLPEKQSVSDRTVSRTRKRGNQISEGSIKADKEESEKHKDAGAESGDKSNRVQVEQGNSIEGDGNSEHSLELKERLAEMNPEVPALHKPRSAGKVLRQINHFIQMGYTDENICRAYKQLPNLAGMNYNKFKEKITFYHNNQLIKGCNFRIHPGVLGLTIPKLQERIGYLKELGMTTEDISRAVTISPALLTYSLQNRIPDYIEYFRQFNLPKDKVIKMLIKTPTMIGLSTKTIDYKLEVIRSMGFTHSQISRLVSNYPVILGYSMGKDGCIAEKLNFYFKNTNLTPEALVRNPSLLCYNFKNRIKFRYEVAKVLDKPFFPRRHVLLTNSEFTREMGLNEKAIGYLQSCYSESTDLILNREVKSTIETLNQESIDQDTSV